MWPTFDQVCLFGQISSYFYLSHKLVEFIWNERNKNSSNEWTHFYKEVFFYMKYHKVVHSFHLLKLEDTLESTFLVTLYLELQFHGNILVYVFELLFVFSCSWAFKIIFKESAKHFQEEGKIFFFRHHAYIILRLCWQTYI